MRTDQDDLAGLFKALGDPTRLAVIARLADGPASVSDLAEPFQMAGPSFLKHLRVLEEAGLVATQKKGRVRTVALAPEKMRDMADWVAAHRRAWERRLDRLGDFLKEERDD